jgi:hypothetical protein
MSNRVCAFADWRRERMMRMFEAPLRLRVAGAGEAARLRRAHNNAQGIEAVRGHPHRKTWSRTSVGTFDIAYSCNLASGVPAKRLSKGQHQLAE